jgi:PAS domain S-box-containing protein
MKNILKYLNPIEHLGENNYSIFFPLLTMVIVTVISELFANFVIRDPMIVSFYVIYLYVALIIYFAFRRGLVGGVTATLITVGYYFYIIYSRHYHGDQQRAGIDTTLVLGTIFLLLAGIIGWLKQTIDGLIERESNARRQMETIIEQLPVGVLITDNNGVLIQRNKRVDQILGIKVPIGSVIGKNTLNNNSSNGEMASHRQIPIERVLHTGKGVMGEDVQLKRKDGRITYLRVSSSPIRKHDGKIIAAASIINDITDQKELEARKDDFINMASHELKTPITSMKIYIEFLLQKLKGNKDSRTLKTLHSIGYQTDRLEDIVNNLLDVSRLQTGKLHFSKEKFNLIELVRETMESLQGATKQQTLMMEGSRALTVFADKFRIYQVITNLITNAIKYSYPDSTIKIKVRKTDNKAVVSVQDFGIGIDADQQKKVFERLYQVTNDTKKTFPGFGMGLYISEQIIKRHKGRIWVESEKGKGSTFFFSLPLT